MADVADVQIGPADERIQARFNGHDGLLIGITKQSTANPLDLSKAMVKEVALINEGLPEGMSLDIAYDSSVFIQESIKSVYYTIGEAIVLVILVIFFFLRSVRASLIPIVTIPVSLIGAFGFMYFFGFSINTLTLLAMVLAIGLVVDDAIVVLENVYRHIEEGKTRWQAAMAGSREIGFAIVAMTLTLVTVYAPLAFATGRTGRLFIEFALTLAGAVLVSGFVALTLTPMMCSTTLRTEQSHGRLYRFIETILVSLTTRYSNGLARALRHRALVLMVGVAVALASGFLFTMIKSELAPTEDRGVIFGVISGPEGSTLDYTLNTVEQVEGFYSDVPEMQSYQSVIGFPTVTDSFAILRLKPWNERERSQQ